MAGGTRPGGSSASTRPPNVEFRHGYIEDLAGAGIAGESIDLVVSNCVLNLSPDKPCAFAEIFRVLKQGGELYFSDIYADRRLSAAPLPDHVPSDMPQEGRLWLGGRGSGSVYLRCGCRDGQGGRRGRSCLRLGEPGHGSWSCLPGWSCDLCVLAGADNAPSRVVRASENLARQRDGRLADGFENI